MDFISAQSTAQLADEYWQNQAAELLSEAGTLEGYPKWNFAMLMGRAVRQYNAQLMEQIGVPTSPSMSRPFKTEELQGALEKLNVQYLATLPNVGTGGLIEATILDVTRHAVKFHLGLEELPTIL